jgi:hypothetical protein
LEWVLVWAVGLATVAPVGSVGWAVVWAVVRAVEWAVVCAVVWAVKWLL